MPILSGQTSFTGLSGIQPNLVFIDTNDTVATVTTAGYLNHVVQEGMLTLQNGYMALVNTKVDQNPHTPRVPIWLQVSITGTAPNLVYSLVEPTNGGGAIFPGNVQAGSNGIAGGFISYPAALNSGFLNLFATANSGAFNTLITNAALGQTTTFTLPDPGSANGRILVAGAALVSGNLVRAAGVAGSMIDAGIASANVQLKTDIKAVTTADIGGAGAGPITVASATLTAASVIVATIKSSSNAVAVAKCIAGAGNFDITFTGDPGAACVVNYIAYVATQ